MKWRLPVAMKRVKERGVNIGLPCVAVQHFMKLVLPILGISEIRKWC
jgi:hypothetical protein